MKLKKCFWVLMVSLLLGAGCTWAREGSADLERACGLLRDGRYEQAAQHYQRALREDPGNAYAALGLGLAQKGQGRMAEAQNTLEQILSRYPDFAPAYYNLGLIYEGQGKMAQAKQAYQAFVQHSRGNIPPSPEVRIKLRDMGLL